MILLVPHVNVRRKLPLLSLIPENPVFQTFEDGISAITTDEESSGVLLTTPKAQSVSPILLPLYFSVSAESSHDLQKTIGWVAK